MRTKSKNIIPSIWIEWWNLKQINFLQEGQRQKLKIKIIRSKLKNIIFVNWDGIMKLKINKTSTKGSRTKIKN